MPTSASRCTRTIEKIVGDDAAVIPMFYYRHTRVASDRVNDGVYSPNGLFTFDTVWLRAGCSRVGTSSHVPETAHCVPGHPRVPRHTSFYPA